MMKELLKLNTTNGLLVEFLMNSGIPDGPFKSQFLNLPQICLVSIISHTHIRKKGSRKQSF